MIYSFSMTNAPRFFSNSTEILRSHVGRFNQPITFNLKIRSTRPDNVSMRSTSSGGSPTAVVGKALLTAASLKNPTAFVLSPTSVRFAFIGAHTDDPMTVWFVLPMTKIIDVK